MPQHQSSTAVLRTSQSGADHGHEPVAVLAAEVAAACRERPEMMARRVVAALEHAVANPHLLRPDQRIAWPDDYARHLVHSDPAGRFTIVSIAWSPGQFSPPHAHHTWCAYAVQENPLEETLYGWDHGTNLARLERTELRPSGYACFSHAGFDQIHRLGNCGSEPAISIHVYGIERQRVASHVNRLVETTNETGSGE